MRPGARRIVYPGTFDPITKGHVDLVERAAQLFDEVIVAIAADSTKKPLFTLAERQALTGHALEALGTSIRVTTFHGLLVEFVAQTGANAILRGLRAVSDFEFEFQMALMNRRLADQIETIFVMPRDSYTYLSSSIIKEIARLGGDISSFVPDGVATALRQKYR